MLALYLKSVTILFIFMVQVPHQEYIQLKVNLHIFIQRSQHQAILMTKSLIVSSNVQVWRTTTAVAQAICNNGWERIRSNERTGRTSNLFQIKNVSVFPLPPPQHSTRC